MDKVLAERYTSLRLLCFIQKDSDDETMSVFWVVVQLRSIAFCDSFLSWTIRAPNDSGCVKADEEQHSHRVSVRFCVRVVYQWLRRIIENWENKFMQIYIKTISFKKFHSELAEAKKRAEMPTTLKKHVRGERADALEAQAIPRPMGSDFSSWGYTVSSPCIDKNRPVMPCPQGMTLGKWGTDCKSW